MILDVSNAPPAGKSGQLPAANSIYDKLSRLNAGETARLLVERGGARQTVAVKLGSLADPSSTSLVIPANDYSVNAL